MKLLSVHSAAGYHALNVTYSQCNAKQLLQLVLYDGVIFIIEFNKAICPSVYLCSVLQKHDVICTKKHDVIFHKLDVTLHTSDSVIRLYSLIAICATIPFSAKRMRAR